MSSRVRVSLGGYIIRLLCWLWSIWRQFWCTHSRVHALGESAYHCSRCGRITRRRA